MLSNDKYPTVSVIITTYNGGGYIGDTLRSIQRQTFGNWEVVIVDDGSTDNTEQVVRELGDRRILFFKAGRIGRNGKLKNIGLQLCRAELIAYLDHDDLWDEKKLEKQVAAMNANPNAGFCLTGGYNFREMARPLEYFYKRVEGEWTGWVFHSIFRSELALWTQALLLRRGCIDEVGGFDEDKIFADPAFIAKLASRFQAVLLYEPLVFRRLHDRNYSTSNWVEGQEEGITMIREYVQKKLLPKRIGGEALYKSYLHYGDKYLAIRQNRKAIVQFIKAWRYKPGSWVAIRKMVKATLMGV